MLLVLTLTACGANEFDISNTVPEVNVDTDVVDVYNVGQTTKLVDEKINRLVNSENLVGWDSLKEIPDRYVEGVLQTLDTAEQSVVTGTNIKDVFAQTTIMNYLSWVFDYYSEFKFVKTDTGLIGYDDATQTFVIDTVYRTDNSAKKPYTKIPDIIRGEPNEDIKLKVRYTAYMNSIQEDYGYNYYDYGYDDTPIYNYQTDNEQGVSDTDNGATDEDGEKSLLFGKETSQKTAFLLGSNNSELTIRWIINKLDTVGVLQVTSAYVVDYKSGYECGNLETDLITTTLADFILRVNICENDVNYQGLYKLYDNFGRYVDQYIRLNECTYTTRLSKIEGILDRNADITRLLITSELGQRVIHGNTTMGVYLETAIWTVRWTADTFKVIDTEVVSLELKEEYQKVVNDDHMKITDELKIAIAEDNEDVKPEITKYLATIFDMIETGDTNKLVDPTKTISQKTHLETILNGLNKYDAKYTFITDWVYTSAISSNIKLREYYILGNSTFEAFSDIRLNKYIVDDVATWYISDYETTYIAEVPNNAIEYYSGSLEVSTK